MATTFQERVRKNALRIRGELDVSVLLLSYMMKDDVLDCRNKATIQSGATYHSKADLLIEFLQKSTNPNTERVFINALIATGSSHIVEMLCGPSPPAAPRKAEPRKAEPRKAEPRKAEPKKVEPRKAPAPTVKYAAAKPAVKKGPSKCLWKDDEEEEPAVKKSGGPSKCLWKDDEEEEPAVKKSGGPSKCLWKDDEEPAVVKPAVKKSGGPSKCLWDED